MWRTKIIEKITKNQVEIYMGSIITFIFLITGLYLQHLLHEYSHVLVANLLGEKVLKIHWLTYHGGTRVFYENEPDFEFQVKRKWGIIAGAGYIVTNCLAYILVGIYMIIQGSWLKVFVCILSMIFLFLDSLYFTLGSIFDFGDIIGVRKAFNLYKSSTIIFSSLVLLINILIIVVVFY